MSQGDTPITIVGNIVAEPELRYTPNGAAVCNFRVASTPRTFDKNTSQWVDGDALFLTCNIWRQAAENVANSFTKGDRVIVVGNLKQRSFENKQGERRSVIELEADEVGPSLKFATAQVVKSTQNSRSSAQAPQGGWGNSSQSQQQPQQGNDTWGGGQQQGFNGTNDDPPF